jgi:hypothetical protein
MPSLDSTILDALATAGAALGVLALLTGLAAHARISRLRHDVTARPRRIEGPVLGRSLRRSGGLEGLHQAIVSLQSQVAVLREGMEDTIQRVGVVRYDAFQDMGARLSFSVALLDERGDGFVLSSITGRNDTRNYVKTVRNCAGEQPLSPEEQQAVDEAMAAAGRTMRASA